MESNPIASAHFGGFDDPIENWSKLPHSLIEALPMIGSLAELKVILYILRHTWGYQDTEKRITLDEFARGRRTRDKRRIDGGTGMTIRSIRMGLSQAEEHGFITRVINRSDKARTKITYSLTMRITPPEESDLRTTLPPTTSRVRVALPDAVRIFRTQTHRYPPKSWYVEIGRRVGSDPAALARWGELVKDWVGHGWNPSNVASMLTKFQEEQPVPTTHISSFTNPLTGKVEQVKHGNQDTATSTE